MSKTYWAFLCLLLAGFLVHQTNGQYFEYEESEDEEEDEEPEPEKTTVQISTTPAITTRKPLYQENLYNMSFAEQFQALIAYDSSTTVNSTNANSTTTPAPKNITKIVTTTTRRPRTTVPSRPEEIGLSVGGIISSAQRFNIPAIVDNALSIRQDNEPVRKLVKNILDTIFCAPILINLSDCGRKYANQNKEKDPTTTAKPKRRRRRTTTLAPNNATKVVADNSTKST